MVADETKRELQAELRRRLRRFPVEKIAKAAKLPTVEVIRFMDGGEELASEQTTALLAIANVILANQQGGDTDNCDCPGCTLRRMLSSKGVTIHQVTLPADKSAEPTKPENNVIDGINWNLVPYWFPLALSIAAAVLAMVSLGIAVSKYL